METGYLPKTTLSEFDRFLPHLKKINHRYLFSGCASGDANPIAQAFFPRGIVAIAAITGSGAIGGP